jgi:hypothetical protein
MRSTDQHCVRTVHDVHEAVSNESGEAAYSERTVIRKLYHTKSVSRAPDGVEKALKYLAKM